MANETFDEMADRVIAAMESAVAVQVARHVRNLGAEHEAEFLRLLQKMELRLTSLEYQNGRHAENLQALNREQKRPKQHA